MSWKLNAAEKLTITTGDGQTYQPLYINTVKSFDFNIAEFNFPGVEGTLVNRGQRKGSTLTLSIIFQGEDHLDTAEQFEQSSKDTRPWTVNHPMHGVLKMQPTKITFDNTKYNTSEITIQLIETIIRDAPVVSVDPVNQVQINAANLDETTSESFAADIQLTTTDTVLMGDALDEAYTDGSAIVESDDDLQEYFDLYQTAAAEVLNATAEPLAAITAVRSMLTAPSLFAQTVKGRLNMLQEQLTSLLNRSFETPNEKHIFENYGNGFVSAMVLTTTYPLNDDDYQSAVDVLDIIEQISGQYDAYVTGLENLQTITADDTNSYTPDQAALSGLQLQVSYCLSHLLDIALGAQQEREVVLEYDSNIIVQAHRFYGLAADGGSIDRFIKTNNIGLKERLQIKKGRILKYYI